jgi:hypothetical protein
VIIELEMIGSRGARQNLIGRVRDANRPAGSILRLLASIGFVDVSLNPKRALTTHDSIFSRPLRHNPCSRV